MMASPQRKILLLLGVVALVMILLSLSLPSLRMLPGTPLASQPGDMSMGGGGGGFEGGDWLLVLVRGFMALMLVLLPVYIIYNLLSAQGRRRLLTDLILFGSLFLLAMWLSNLERAPVEPEQQEEGQPSGYELPGELSGGQVAPTFEAYTPPWMMALTVVTSAFFVALAAFALSRYLSIHRKRAPSFLHEFAQQAEEALVSLDAGGDYQDVVVRCYAQMSRALQQERGIQRSQAMTTYEFEQELLTKGFPFQPIHQLTALFEQVRYGHQPTSERDKITAIDSLTDILAYCRGQA